MRRGPTIPAALVAAFVFLAPATAAPEDPPAVKAPPATPPESTMLLSLSEAIRLGLRANLSLQAGSIDVPIAGERLCAEVASFDTLLTADVNLAHTETPSTSSFFGTPIVSDQTIESSVGLTRRLPRGTTLTLLYLADRKDTDSSFVTVDPSWTESLSLEATHPLLRGAGDVVLAEVRRARNGIRVADESYRALGEDVIFRIVAAYWELAYAERQVEARLKSEGVAGELLSDAKSREEAQVGTPLDVAEARAGVERRRGDRIVAENLRGAAEDALRVLILPFGRGTTAAARIVPIDDGRAPSATAPEEGGEERYVRLALGTRPELRASEAELGNRGIDVAIARDAVKPQLDLLARIGTDGLDEGFGGAFGDVASARAASASVGLQFSMYLGRRAARANERLSEWACRQARLRHRELENLTVAEVRAALREISGARALMAAADAEVAASREGLDGEKDRLTSGKSTPFRVLEKDEVLTDAITRGNRAATQLKIGEARLWRAVGVLARTLGVSLPSAGR